MTTQQPHGSSINDKAAIAADVRDHARKKERREPTDEGEASLLVVGDVTSPESDVRAVTIESDDTGARIPLQRAAADEAHLKTSVGRELCDAFPSVPAEQVTILVECLWSHFAGAAVRDFVPLLVRKQAKEELLDHLGTRAEAMAPVPLALPTAHP